MYICKLLINTVHIVTNVCCLCVVQYLGGDGVDVLNFAERARTVNARGEYVDHRYD